jgi:hypothetical protein
MFLGSGKFSSYKSVAWSNFAFMTAWFWVAIVSMENGKLKMENGRSTENGKWAKQWKMDDQRTMDSGEWVINGKRYVENGEWTINGKWKMDQM